MSEDRRGHTADRYDGKLLNQHADGDPNPAEKDIHVLKLTGGVGGNTPKAAGGPGDKAQPAGGPGGDKAKPAGGPGGDKAKPAGGPGGDTAKPAGGPGGDTAKPAGGPGGDTAKPAGGPGGDKAQPAGGPGGDTAKAAGGPGGDTLDPTQVTGVSFTGVCDKIAGVLKMQVTVTVLTSCAAAVVTTLITLTLHAPAPASVCSNGTVLPDKRLSTADWWVNSSLVILTTSDKTYLIDLHSFSQQGSFPAFRKEIMDANKAQTNNTLTMLTSLELRLNESLGNMSESCDGKVGNLETALMIDIRALNTSLMGEHLRLDKLNETLLVVQNTFELLVEDQARLLKQLTENNETMRRLIEDVLSRVSQNVSVLEYMYMYDKTLHATSGLSVFWILTSIVVGIVIDIPILFCLLGKWIDQGRELSVSDRKFDHRGQGVTRKGTSSPTPDMNSEIDIEFPYLETAVTLIGFDVHTLRQCKLLVQSIGSDLGITVTDFRINEPKDLLTVVGSKVMLVIVDYNERDVILEEPNLLQGGNKVATTKVLLKNRVDVFVIYVGHQESGSLPGTDLFHRTLTSVRKHPILRSLSDKGRVMSVHRSFSPLQSEQLGKAFRKM